MKKIIPALAFIACFADILSADIGENYKKGGTGLSGGISFYNNFSRILTEADQYNFWSLSIRPNIDFFIVDNFAVSLSPHMYISRKDYVVPTGTYFHPVWKMRDDNMEYGIGLGVLHAIVSRPEATTGFVPEVGGSVEALFVPPGTHTVD